MKSFYSGSVLIQNYSVSDMPTYTSNKSNIVVGIGEVLWDMLPAGKRLGGAPANFAYHAAMNGCHAAVVSAVGRDELGDEILASLESKPLECHIARTPYPTGTVAVDLDAAGIPHYSITENVAWDNIPFTDDLAATAKRTAAVCFGSLARRSPASRATIDKFLDTLPTEALIVFDANLRSNFYCADDIGSCISRCNILKLNDEELPVVADLLRLPTAGNTTSNEADAPCRRLIELYNLDTVILTCGSAGSHVFTSSGEHSFLPTPHVEVSDTVGAGDSFTAAYVASILHGSTPAEAHAAAVRTAAYVCTRPGAIPEYQI